MQFGDFEFEAKEQGAQVIDLGDRQWFALASAPRHAVLDHGQDQRAEEMPASGQRPFEQTQDRRPLAAARPEFFPATNMSGLRFSPGDKRRGGERAVWLMENAKMQRLPAIAQKCQWRATWPRSPWPSTHPAPHL
jgi:hypothetical protein